MASKNAPRAENKNISSKKVICYNKFRISITKFFIYNFNYPLIYCIQGGKE